MYFIIPGHHTHLPYIHQYISYNPGATWPADFHSKPRQIGFSNIRPTLSQSVTRRDSPQCCFNHPVNAPGSNRCPHPSHRVAWNFRTRDSKSIDAENDRNGTPAARASSMIRCRIIVSAVVHRQSFIERPPLLSPPTPGELLRARPLPRRGPIPPSIPPTPIGGTCCSAECITSGARGRGERLWCAAVPAPVSPQLNQAAFHLGGITSWRQKALA